MRILIVSLLLGLVVAQDAWAARRTAPMAPLAQELAITANNVDSVELRAAFRTLLQRHKLSEVDFPWEQYRSLRLAFEATRDGGFFGARWDITNREPSSKVLWSALAEGQPVVGECDELSVWMTEFACAWGVRNAGLYWPTWNHTIVASEPKPGVRILWPTTQIFLSCDSDLDPPEFNPRKQKRVFACPANSGAGAMEIRSAWVQDLIKRFAVHALAGPTVWDLLRFHRMGRAPSSGDGCPARQRQLAQQLMQNSLTSQQEESIRFYLERELPSATKEDPMTWLRRLAR
jgi:hypothetical protein